MITTDSRTSRHALLAAEFGLLALAVGTAATFTRLFTGWEFLVRLAPAVLLAWALALTLRRLRLGVGPSLLIHLAIGAIVLPLLYVRGTQVLGLLPSPTTATQARLDITNSFSAIADLVAPVTATTGFLVVIAAALWVLAFFGDTAAFRYRGPVQAAVPYAAVFVAAGILARESGRISAAICFGIGVAIYAVTQRALSAGELRWASGDGAAGTRATVTGAAVVAIAALGLGAVAGPFIPADDEPIINLRELGKGRGPRTVVSPFVSIRSLLGERSDQIMFRVQSPAPAYWRLTALEEFRPEGDIWVSHGTYDETDGQLPASLDDDVPTRRLPQRVEIAGLSSEWLPGAYAPDRIESTAPVSYSAESSSIILAEDASGGAVDYSLESLVPDFTQVTATPGAPNAVDPIHLEAPDLDPDERELLDQVIGDATDPMQQMLALQNWFRSEFEYDEDVDYSDESDSLSAFLRRREGFCQQFSSAFALLARELGLPSRVAVGFTPGDQTVDSDGTVEFVVRGRHAHAWPEVYFAGAGWVPFEPTPQRGDPQAEGHTGVPPEQADPPPSQAATTTSVAPSATTAPAPPTTAGSELDATETPDPEPVEQAGGTGGVPWLALGAVVVLLAAVGAAAVAARRRRGPRDADPHSLQVADAWSDAVRSLQPLDLRPGDHETPVEFAARVDAQLGADLLGALAVSETVRRYAPEDASAETAREAEAAARQVGEHVRSVTTRGQRVAALVGRRGGDPNEQERPGAAE